jgi:hypothetical protein
MYLKPYVVSHSGAVSKAEQMSLHHRGGLTKMAEEQQKP